MNAAQKAREARQHYALRAGQIQARIASYDGNEVVGMNTTVKAIVESKYLDRDGWPISGDDLALAKAGKIA